MRVYGTERIVQQVEVRVAVDCSGQADPLLLSTTQVDALGIGGVGYDLVQINMLQVKFKSCFYKYLISSQYSTEVDNRQ